MMVKERVAENYGRSATRWAPAAPRLDHAAEHRGCLPRHAGGIQPTAPIRHVTTAIEVMACGCSPRATTRRPGAALTRRRSGMRSTVTPGRASARPGTGRSCPSFNPANSATAVRLPAALPSTKCCGPMESAAPQRITTCDVGKTVGRRIARGNSPLETSASSTAAGVQTGVINAEEVTP